MKKQKLLKVFCKRKSVFRILVIMKLFFTFFILATFSICAENVHSQSKQVNLDCNNMKLSEVLREIETQTGYMFFYNHKEINSEKAISLKAVSQPVNKVLDGIFNNTNVNYSMLEDHIVLSTNPLLLKEQNAKAVQQGIVIKGEVIDKEGEPLPGVTVLIKGTQKGTVTDFEGKYSIEVPAAGTVLVFSYLGFLTQEQTFRDNKVIDAILEEDTQKLEEVVVVGYGTQKKLNLTGAISSVNSEVLEDRPITNLGSGLQGTIANLNITSSNGSPGQGSTFNVRGITNLSGTGPLVLVDGIQMDPNLLNPQDIKSVTVLKDAASAAIYGARAAYGVVLITTKTGYVTQKPIVSFNMNYSENKPTVHPTYMNSLEYTQWMNDANQTSNGSDYFDEVTMEHVRAYYNDPVNNQSVFHHPDDASSMYRYCGNTDWYKTLNKNTYPMQQYNLNITGGSKDVKYYASLGYFNQKGIARFVDENYNRFNLMQNITYRVNNWLEVGLRTTANVTDNKSGGRNNGNSSSVNSILASDSRPLMPLYHPDGNFSGYSGNGYFTNTAAWQSQGGDSRTRVNDLWATGLIRLKPLEGLIINMDYTYNYYGSVFKNHTREYWDYDAVGPAVIFPHTSPNSAAYFESDDRYSALNLYGEYEKTFAEKHYFKAMAGFNQEQKTYRGFSAKRANLIVNDIPYINIASGERTVSDNESEWALRGAFFRLNYVFDERYLIEVNGRYDGSSRFPKDDRFEFFPSISGGWRISKEKFWDNLHHVVNDLKFRASYGSLGNQAVVSEYPYIATYSTNQIQYLFNGEKQMGVIPPGLVSNQLTWETVSQYDLGLDAALFDSKLTASFDYYQRTTKDMLTKSKTLPAILATDEPQTNAADLRTRGWETSISWTQLLDNDIKYGLTFILADYQAEITKYDNPTKNLGDNSSEYYVGKKWGEIWGFETEGLFKTDEEAQAWDQSQIGGYTAKAGDIKLADLDGKPGITRGANTVDDPGDRKIIGNTTPRYSFGFRAYGEWKGFDLNVFFQGVIKRDILPANPFYLDHYGSEWSVPQKMNYDYWRPDNTEAFFPRARFDGSIVREAQTRFLQNGAYCRLKQLTVGYTIPEQITKKAGISKFRVYFSGDNLWEYSKMDKTFDPELATVNAYPFFRSYSFGANLTF